MSEPTVTTAGRHPAVDAVVRAVKGRDRWVLAAGCALQLVVLVAMIGMRAWVLWHGDVYYVRVRPVDPRDLFRGEFVILSYDFSRVPPDGLADLPGYRQHPADFAGRDVYVTLVPEGDGKHWRADRFTANRPADGPFLHGRLTARGLVEYGIESLFVREGGGHR
jgi:uncharacterized membrane-anchored protein